MCILILSIYNDIGSQLVGGMLASNSPSETNVFLHKGDSFAMNGAKIGIFEQRNKVSLTGLLQNLQSL